MNSNQGVSSNRESSSGLLSSDNNSKPAAGSRPRSRLQVPPPPLSRRGLLARQRMMDEFENGLDFQPSAKVIRSSKGSILTSNHVAVSTEQDDIHLELDKDAGSNGVTSSNSIGDVHENRESHHSSLYGGAVISELIVERPFCQPQQPKKMSRFKMKQVQLNNQQEQQQQQQQGGFPSFDIPVGTLTRRGKIDLDAKGSLSHLVVVKKISDECSSSSADAADNIIANMSQDEIAESVQEIKSILSSDAIQFLKNRKHHKTKGAKVGQDGPQLGKGMIEENSIKVSQRLDSQNNLQQEREHTFKVLSNIQTEEELEEAFRRVMGDVDNARGPIEEEEEEESELHGATKLLRSTAPRQRTLGAKTVCEILEDRVRYLSELPDQNWYEDVSSYPDILPVSLRCLLDTPSPQNNIQLISYVLRAICALLILFSHPEHRVGLSMTACAGATVNDADNVLQQDVMCDVVLACPGYQIYSREKANVIDNTAFGDECYTTNASADSVKSDAKAFYTDPAWTLLSKMRFIPCISHILSTLGRTTQTATSCRPPIISSGTVMAICGILSGLGMRSPGAAVAIAQHKDLLPSLFTLTLEPENSGDDSFVVDTAAAFPVIYMSCVLCGQSRIAAKTLESVMESVVYIIANDPANRQEFQLQQWCLIFWRKLLRYGMGISYLPTLLPMSVRQLTSSNQTPFSLAAEYFSAFAVICQCVKVARYQYSVQSESTKLVLDDADREILAMSGLWFSSHAQNSIKFFVESSDTDSRYHLKLSSAKLRFLSSYVDASSPTDINGKILASTNVNFVSMIRIDDFLLALKNVAESKCLKSAIFGILSLNSISARTTRLMQDEATCCAFVEEFFTSVSILVEKINDMSYTAQETKIDSSYDAELDSLTAKTYAHSTSFINKSALCQYNDCCPKSRILWANKAYYSVLHFHTMAIRSLRISSKITLTSLLQSVQSYFFSLIGRLQRGEEAKAVKLLKLDSFFAVITDYGAVEKSLIASSLRKLITRELSENPAAQAQLDHSYKLEGRPGLVHERVGHFGLNSLRAGNDIMPGNSDQSPHDSLILPLGKDWAWKLIPYPVGTDQEEQITLTNISTIVNSTLRFLLYVEESDMDFSKSLHPGAKVYFLLNSCLYPEAVISDEEYSHLISKLFALYQAAAVMDGKATARAFIVTCYEHSKYFKENIADRADYDHLSKLFFSDIDLAEDMGLTSKDFKAFDEFVDDLCTAFIDFGAQYNSFVHSVRFLLSPFMPVRIINRTLGNLKDILHLLTTVDESKDEGKTELKNCLRYFYAGGLPFLDHSQRNHSSTLDILASALKTGSFDLPQRQDGFFFLYAVGCLARNLASNAVKCECGVKSMKRRVEHLKKNTWAKISATAIAAMKEKCASADHLASIVIRKDDTARIFDFDETVQNLCDMYHTQTC
mmetsp:Transcript_15400/g.29015  ORF Transcript_15400/g.29015 Transcript_15400/m.29015 type:complete len:1418 (-) Transcript_15400:2762-7015(-)